MGNITDRPKAPAPQVVYVPQYTYVPSGDGEEEADTGAAVAEQRRQSLLSRNRSRLGTILTGFRGVLTPAGDDQRKTLLGE